MLFKVTFALILMVLGGCVTNQESAPEVVGPPFDAGSVARLIPSRVKDAKGWGDDIAKAIIATEVSLNRENACAVIAVIEQESNYQTDPAVKDLPKITRAGLLKKLEPLGPLAEAALAALLTGKAPGTDENFAVRIDHLRTEQDLDQLFRDIASAYKDKFPGTFAVGQALSWLLGKNLKELNPVTTIGSMQVKVNFAAELPGFESLDDAGVRERLYTRYGGIQAGTARLLGYKADYNDMIYRFADYNAGVYASRNAAFQEQLARLTGRALAFDGDLLAYESDGSLKDAGSQTLTAMLAFGKLNDIGEWSISRAAKKEKTKEFEETSIWKAVRSAIEKKTKQAPAYARIPDLKLESPKLQKPRSTGWFANAVKRRYLSCLDAAR